MTDSQEWWPANSKQGEEERQADDGGGLAAVRADHRRGPR